MTPAARTRSRTRQQARELSLEDVRSTYYEASGKASDIARQAAFAGIAIAWLLSGATLTSNNRLHIPDDLLRAGAALVLALVLDMLHYAYRTAAWGGYARYLENRDRTQTEAPDWINRIAIGLFIVKLLAVGVAYVLLLFALLDRLGR